MNPVPEPPPYVTSLEEVTWGISLVALTLVVHAMGMIFTQYWASRFRQGFGSFHLHRPFLAGIFGVILASWLIVLVHCLEVILWAAFFQWKKCFQTFSIATYFSFSAYTTLGSNYDLPQKWRLLEGMIATAGLLAFAWSTGVLLTLATSFQEQQVKFLTARSSRNQRAPVRNRPDKA